MSDAGTRHLPPLPVGALVLVDLLGVIAATLLADQAASRLPALPGLQDAGPLATNVLVAWLLARSLIVGLGLVVLGQHGLLRDTHARWSFPRVVLVTGGATGLMIVFLVLLEQRRVDTTFILFEFLLTLLFLTGWRGLVATRIRQEVRWGVRVRNALFIGESATMRELARYLATSLEGRRVVGFIGNPGPAPITSGMWAPVHADLDAAVVENSLRSPRHLWFGLADEPERRAQVIDGLGVEEMYLDSHLDPGQAQAWVKLAQERGIDAHIVPGNPLGATPQAWQLGPHVVLDIHSKPMSKLGWWTKRTMDILGGLVGLVLATPFVLLAAIAIKVEDRKLPVFYGAGRVGHKGRAFKMWKLTTMWPTAQQMEKELGHLNEREGPWLKIDAGKDPRLTKVGRVLRKFTINELPQFWNVVKGDMSLVGPRPPLPDEVATYMEYDFRYFRCLDVKPGMTGLWQVTAKDDPSFDTRLELDLRYMNEWSVWMDVGILFKTIWVAVGRGE